MATGSAPELWATTPIARRTRSRVAQHVVSGDGAGARVGAGEGGEDLDGGGLAGAVGPEEPEDGAGFDGDVHAAQGGHITGVGLDQVGAPPRRAHGWYS